MSLLRLELHRRPLERSVAGLALHLAVASLKIIQLLEFWGQVVLSRVWFLLETLSIRLHAWQWAANHFVFYPLQLRTCLPALNAAPSALKGFSNQRPLESDDLR